MLVSALAWLGAVPELRAQSVNQVRVFTNPPGVAFRVDGVPTTSIATYLWPEGSKHNVSFEPGYNLDAGTRYTYKGWSTNLSSALSFAQPLTATPELRWVRLDFDVEYLLAVSFEAAVPGRVQIVKPGSCEGTFPQSVSCWVGADDQVDIRALPGSGAVFTGWTSGTGVPGPPSSFLLAFPMTRPVSLTPGFGPATVSSASVSLQTDPQELTIIVDGVRRTPPVSFEWGWNSTHRVAVEPNQNSGGVAYVFHSWSDGGDASHDVRVPSPSGAINLSARFVPAHTVRFSTAPPNLKLTVDYRQDWQSYAFGWLPGSVHRVAAPATQTDAQGRRYRFVSWSNDQPAAFDYTAGPPMGDIQLVATYKPLGQATITTSPAGLPLDVDGASCITPCVVERDLGASVRVVPASVLRATDRARLVFRGWNDTAGDRRMIELAEGPRTYLASYVQQSRLTLTVRPPEAAVIRTAPSSADGFYDTGTIVSLAATPNLGFRFSAWSGDVTGPQASPLVTLDSPRDVVLTLDRVPALAPSGVRSAARGGAGDEIAPGSLISIFGANLAPALVTGRSNPLAQTLAGVTVRVDDTFLPLMFVSPGQINAQLPAATPLGFHQITVRLEGYPETSIPINVVRNAPGLFTADASDQPAGVFLGTRGEPITTALPALPGDTVVVLGTGLGPYAPEPPDGFVVDESSIYRLLDPLQVVVGDQAIDVLLVGKSGLGVGLDAVRFRVPADLPASKTLPVKVVVNGRESNTVLLPIAR